MPEYSPKWTASMTKWKYTSPSLIVHLIACKQLTISSRWGPEKRLHKSQLIPKRKVYCSKRCQCLVVPLRQPWYFANFLCAVSQCVWETLRYCSCKLQVYVADVADCRLLGIIQYSILPNHLQNDRPSRLRQRPWALPVLFPRCTC